MKKSTEKKFYNCPRLISDVTLTINYLHHNAGNKVATGYECDSDLKCDIGKPDGQGGYTWNRELCPALEAIQKMNKNIA